LHDLGRSQVRADPVGLLACSVEQVDDPFQRLCWLHGWRRYLAARERFGFGRRPNAGSSGLNTVGAAARSRRNPKSRRPTVTKQARVTIMRGSKSGKDGGETDGS